jgi:hypothetical protein
MTTVTLDAETLARLQKYADHSIDRHQNGAKMKDWEDARSYAVEVANALLWANPDLCDYMRRFNEISEKRKSTK